jgi:hypothetical protein
MGVASGKLMPVVSIPMRAARFAMAIPAAPAGTYRWPFNVEGTGMRGVPVNNPRLV